MAFRRSYKMDQGLRFEIVGARREGDEPYGRIAWEESDTCLSNMSAKSLKHLRNAIDYALVVVHDDHENP